MTTPSADQVVLGSVEEVKNNADNLNLQWILRPATVVSAAGDTTYQCIYDGDTTPTLMISTVGALVNGTRIMVVFIPPSGNYIVNVTSYPNDTAWVDYAMVTFSTGTPPSVGAGSQGGRWLKIGHKTIIFEGYVLFGAGMSQGTGRYFFPVPFARATNAFAATGTGYILDSGLANRGAFAVNFASLTTEVFLTNTPSGDVGAGVPQVFVSGDQILFSITYEVASF